VVRPFRGPFFAFRPRFNLGFGLFVGFPVPYPWDYVAPYPYDYPYGVDPYGPTYDDPNDLDNSSAPPEFSGSSAVASDAETNFGGISFDLMPGDAPVTIDGTNVGTAQTFSPLSAPLTLTPGVHHVVIAKPGYRSLAFDADITAGEVVPYQGTMQPQ
jgi:hypothetical protein